MSSLQLLNSRAGGLVLIALGFLLFGQLGIAPWSPIADDGVGTTSSFVAATRSSDDAVWRGDSSIVAWDATSPDLAWVDGALHLYTVSGERLVDSMFDGSAWRSEDLAVAGLRKGAVGSPTVATPGDAPPRMYLIDDQGGARASVLSAVLQDGHWRLEPGVRLLSAALTDIDALATSDGGIDLYAMINGEVVRFSSHDGLTFQPGEKLSLRGVLSSLEVTEGAARRDLLVLDRTRSPARLVDYALVEGAQPLPRGALRLEGGQPLRGARDRLTDATWLRTPGGDWWMVTAYRAQSYGASS